MPTTNFSASEYLELLRRRERAAWEALVDAYLPQLLRVGRGMGFSVDENQDLVSRSSLPLWKGSVASKGARTFLFGIFYNKVSEHLRNRQRAEVNDPIDEVMESRFDLSGKWRQPPLDIDKALFAREVRGLVRECLETVPRARHIAFYLREIEEMETAEICKKMGVSATNLGVLLFRARDRLRECLERKGLKRS